MSVIEITKQGIKFGKVNNIAEILNNSRTAETKLLRRIRKCKIIFRYSKSLSYGEKNC